MRLVLSLLAMSVSLIAASPAASDEQGRSIESPPKQRYVVLCRWIKQGDETLACPALTLSDGEKGSISDRSQSPFVVGVTQITDPNTKAIAQQPHIVVLDEGIKIDLIVAGRQPDGATVDVTVEQSKITKVAARKINPTTTIQVPAVDITKKRTIDFVKFGETMVVPLGERRSNGATPCLEIVVGVGENIQPNRTSQAANRLVTPSNARRDGILDTILATGAAKVFCQRVSRWERTRGRELDADLGRLKTLCDYASVYVLFPHRAGVVDVLALLSPAIHDPVRVREFEEAVFGCVPGYSAELWDSPSLVKNVEDLGRLPWLWDVTIRTKNVDARLLDGVKRLRVLHRLSICKVTDSGGRAETPQRGLVMGGVTPRVIIQEEEESRLGIQPPIGP